jgi:sarcinarray family protein
MKIKPLTIFGIITLVTLLLFPIVSSDEKIDASAFFSWMQEDGTWHDWVNSTKENEDILYNLSLKIGQPVKCKVNIVIHENCTISFYLYEPGITKAFDVIYGVKHEESLSIDIEGNCVAGLYKYNVLNPGTTIEYTWVLMPNNNWTNGHAPVNAFVQANFKGDTVKGSTGFANPYILNEKWDGPSIDTMNGDFSNENNNNSTGFKIIIVVLAATLVLMFKRKK